VRIFGEARPDEATGKWLYIIYTDAGDVLMQSDAEFDTAEAAEHEMTYMLRGLARRADRDRGMSGP